jgi:hypothetical protein
MASGNVQLNIAFNGEDKLAAVITKSNRAMTRFRKNSDRTAKQTTKGFARIQGTISGIGTKFTEMNSAIMLARQAFGALQSAADAAISGEVANNAEKVFSQIAGGAGQAQKVMERFRKVTRGLLDDTTIQQFAGSLRVAGVEFDQISRILDVSSRVALATGQDLEAVAQKIKEAMLAGEQGAFDRLGVVVKVNEELQKQAKAEGRLVEEMTKHEQVSARLDILQQALGDTMSAAGIKTEELATSLRSSKTAFENFISSVQQSLANATTESAFDQLRDKVEAGFDRTFEELERKGFGGEHFLHPMMAETLSKELNVSIDLIKKAQQEARKEFGGGGPFGIFGVSKSDQFISALTSTIQDADRVAAKGRQEEAQARVDAQKQALEDKQKESKRLVDLEKEKQIQIAELAINGSNMARAMAKAELVEIQIAIGLVNGTIDEAAANMKRRMSEINIDKAIQAEEQEDERKKERRRERAKQRKADLERQAEEKQKAANRELRVLTQTTQLERTLEIEAARSAEDIEAAHLLELRDVREKAAEERKLNAKATSAEILFMQKQAEAEEVRLIRAQTEEIEQIRDAARLKKEENDRKAADKAKQLLEEEREEFQKHMAELGEATERVMGPLDQLVNHEKGASDGMKAFGASAAGTSAAVNVFANETDASKSATDRFVQGLSPAISASGTAASAFVKDTKRKALIQGSFETASSIAAFATGNLIGGAGHAAAAAAFFALAGKSGGGGGAAPAGNAGTLAAGGAKSNLSAAGKGGAVVVNVQGFALGSAKEMGARMAQTIDQARETGLDSAEV